MNQSTQGIIGMLPEIPISDFLSSLNNEMSEVFSQFLPDNAFTSIVITSPLIILIVIFLILGIFALLADFIADAWKIPVAIVVDIIDLMALSSGFYLDILAAASSMIMFFLLTADCNKGIHYGFSVLGPIACIAPIPVLGTLPINTVMMIIAAIADRGI